MEIVIARYKENLDWVSEIDNSKFKITVYDKSDESNNYIKLENKGRESLTYLHHIITNYDNLDDVTVFTQGDPFVHSKQFLSRINSLDKEQIVTLTDLILVDDKNGYPYHYGIYQHGLEIESVWNIISTKPLPMQFEFAAGAMFSVPKKFILGVSLEKYKLFYNLHHMYDNMPWIIERLWMYILKNKI